MREHHGSLEIDGCPRSAWLRRIEGIVDGAPAAESGIERVPGDDFRFVEPVAEVDDLSAPDGGKSISPCSMSLSSIPSKEIASMPSLMRSTTSRISASTRWLSSTSP
ncbi:MAG: hypothetical protein R2843_06280 [Thermomicrobiales bacterium]